MSADHGGRFVRARPCTSDARTRGGARISLERSGDIRTQAVHGRRALGRIQTRARRTGGPVGKGEDTVHVPAHTSLRAEAHNRISSTNKEPPLARRLLGEQRADRLRSAKQSDAAVVGIKLPQRSPARERPPTGVPDRTGNTLVRRHRLGKTGSDTTHIVNGKDRSRLDMARGRSRNIAHHVTQRSQTSFWDGFRGAAHPSDGGPSGNLPLRTRNIVDVAIAILSNGNTDIVGIVHKSKPPAPITSHGTLKEEQRQWAL